MLKCCRYCQVEPNWAYQRDQQAVRSAVCGASTARLSVAAASSLRAASLGNPESSLSYFSVNGSVSRSLSAPAGSHVSPHHCVSPCLSFLSILLTERTSDCCRCQISNTHPPTPTHTRTPRRFVHRPRA